MKLFKKVVLAFLIVVSCKNETNVPQIKNENNAEGKEVTQQRALSEEEKFTLAIENAHKKSSFLEEGMIQFDIDLNFGGNDRLDATISMATNSSRIRIDKKDGSSLIYDGKKVYISPENANDRGARFDMFTWTYFLALPYKLNDSGTFWEKMSDLTLDEKVFDTAKLTFKNGIGDTPDDWYIVYADKENGLIHAAGYIVTFGEGDIKKAEEDPHAIKYSDYTVVNTIPIATSWTYYEWTPALGFGKIIGDATLSNVKFVSFNENFFDKPDNSREITL